MRGDGQLSPPASLTRTTSVSEQSTADSFDDEPILPTPVATPDIEAHEARRERGNDIERIQSGDSEETIHVEEPEPSPRELVRILQCRACDKPLQEPIALPCGNALCRTCLPATRLRQNISYPASPGRLHGFRCLFEECGHEHALSDCSKDVTLGKVLSLVARYVEEFEPCPEQATLLLEEVPHHHYNTRQQPARTRTAPGGKVIATYQMARAGELAYHSEVDYKIPNGEGIMPGAIDGAVISQLKIGSRTELDCQICYGLLLSPLTTPCGHTFCRSCVQRVLDHSAYCPICRSRLSMSPTLSPDQYPSNAKLQSILHVLHPAALRQREAQYMAEAAHHLSNSDELSTPLFICTLAFPTQPTFLHIFEPRYRLMIRRAMETNRRFGMVVQVPPNHSMGVRSEYDDVAGRNPPVYKYGTMLHILNYQPLPDGRSLIETMGVERLEVRRIGERDGYLVGNTKRPDDITIAQEEALEIYEVTSSTLLHPPPGPWVSPTKWAQLQRLPTSDLFGICKRFVDRHRAASAHWLTSSTIAAHGEPPEDMRDFVWWFAAVVPLGDGVKMGLLGKRSVRSRLKECTSWVEGLEHVGLTGGPHRHGQGGGCAVM